MAATLIRGLTRRSDDTVAAQTLDVVRELQRDFLKRDKLYRLIREIVFLEHAVKIPDAYRKTALEVRTHRPFQTLADITAALTVNPPVVQFAPSGDPEADSTVRNSTLREKFFEASRIAQERQAKRRIFRAWMHSIVTKGEGVLKTLPRTSRSWAGYAAYSKTLEAELYSTKGGDLKGADRAYLQKTDAWKRERPYPIASIDVSPESFYYVKGEDGFTACAEVTSVPYFETLARFGHALNRAGQVVPEAMGLPQSEWQSVMSGHRTLKKTELWTWDRCVYVLQGPGDLGGSGNGGIVAKTVRHHFGDADTHTLRGPYFQAFGITTSERDVQFQGVSAIFAYLHLYPLLDSLYTMLHNGVYTFAFPYMTRDQVPGSGLLPDAGSLTLAPGPHVDDNDDELRIEPGDMLPPGVHFIDGPHVNVDVRAAIQLVESMLSEAHPSILSGGTQPGDSGYLANQAQHLASLKYDPILDNAEFALAEQVSFESWLIQNVIGEPVSVWGDVPSRRLGGRTGHGYLTLGPDDLHGNHNYTVRLESKQPTDEVIALRAHAQKRELGAETQQQMVEELGGSWDLVEFGLIIERMQQDPEVQGKLRDTILNGIGIVNAQRMAAAEQAFMAGQGGGGGAVPPDGAGALGGLGAVPTPGAGLPLVPTPQGNVTGPAGGVTPPPRGVIPPGNISGAPGGVQGPPGNATPLPGQQ